MGGCCSVPQTNKAGVAQGGGKAKAKQTNVSSTDDVEGYQAVKLLGRGMAGDTWLMKDKETAKLVAIKLFPRPIPDVQHEPTIREFQTQTDLGPGSVNLINVYEAILTPRHLGLVMEVADGGSLTTMVADKAATSPPGQMVLDEEEARFYFTQFVDAMAYCHAHGIAHRDLKLDNALLDSSRPAVLKLCDFGFARTFGAAGARLERVNSHLGTPEYMSPELLHSGIANAQGKSEEYNPQETDVWAAGIMLTVCLLGAFPFDHSAANIPGSTEDELDLWKQEVNQGWANSEFIKSNVGALPPKCRELLDQIFEVDPKQRITVDGIRANAWFSQPFGEPWASTLSRIRRDNEDLIQHVRERRLDMDKVKSRNVALRKLIDEACTKGGGVSSSFASKPLRPLEQVSKGNNNRIDLSEAAVLVSGSMIARHESDLVVDRTNPNRHKSSHSGFDLPEGDSEEPANSGLSQ